MLERIIIALIQIVVPVLLDKLVDSQEAPTITEGMVKDYEIKVGVPELKRIQRATRRAHKRRQA